MPRPVINLADLDIRRKPSKAGAPETAGQPGYRHIGKPADQHDYWEDE